MYRQGDVLIVADRVPAQERQPVRDGVLVYGEATGHAHRVEGGAVFDVGGTRFIEASSGARVVHEEHETIELPEGSYRIVRQREYDEGEIRYVAD
jgi:hypothetical protein